MPDFTVPLVQVDELEYSPDCRLPLLDHDRAVYGTLTADGFHDWRLHDRKPFAGYEWIHDRRSPESILSEQVANLTDGWLEVWYCTRCRLVDERRVPVPNPPMTERPRPA